MNAVQKSSGSTLDGYRIQPVDRKSNTDCTLKWLMLFHQYLYWLEMVNLIINIYIYYIDIKISVFNVFFDTFKEKTGRGKYW